MSNARELSQIATAIVVDTSKNVSVAEKITVTKDSSISGLTVGKGGGAVSTNTAVGASALSATATGIYNTGVGYFAVKSVTSGTSNTGIGLAALEKATTGAENTALGAFSLNSNTTANSNIGVGYYSLYANTTGANNVAVGNQALVQNTTASNNTAVGYQAGYSNTTGTANTFFGQASGYSATTANGNCLVGLQAGYSLTTGSGNTFVGSYNTSNGYAPGYFMTTGAKNTILGNYSGNNGGLDIRTASNHIVLSDGDGNPKWFHDGGNSWAINGSSSTQTGGIIFNNNVRTKNWEIASNSTNWFLADADFSNYAFLAQNFTAWSFASDSRIKKNIVDLDKGLTTVLALKPKRYSLINSDKEDIGFIAQDMKDVLPEAVTGEELPYLESDTPQEKAAKTLGISKETIIPVLVKAIQELNAKLEAQALEIAQLKGN